MSVLLVQIFLLLLGAFLLGATLACLFRRAFATSRDDSVVQDSAPVTIAGIPPVQPAVAASPESQRFERALAGSATGAAPLPAGTPVIEVQRSTAPQPAPAPARSVVEAPKAPVAPAAQVAPPAPAPVPTPTSAPIAKAPEPAAAPAPIEAKPVPASQAAERVLSYTEIAAAAPQVPARELSYAEVMAKAAGAVATQIFSGPADDLTRVRGIDLVTQARLNQLGVGTFADVAGWTASDVTRFSQSLGISGRIEKENWIEQAQVLAKGGGADLKPQRTAGDVASGVPAAAALNSLHRIIGIDPDTEAVLLANGVRHIADVAGWGAADIEKFEGLLGQPGRIEHENWIGQARYLTGAAPVAAVVAAAAATATAAVSTPKAEAAAAPVSKPMESAPAPAAAPASAPARSDTLAGLRSVRSEALRGDAPYPLSGEIDDLKRIRGIGVLIEKKLHALNIISYEQVANWTRADIDRISDSLDFKGRIERENWVEQARILASGGQTEFSRRADRGEV